MQLKRMFILFFLGGVLLGALVIASSFLPENDPPELQSVALMKRQLRETDAEIGLAENAKCTNELSSNNDSLPNVEFYRICTVELAATSERFVFRMAFNHRGSIEFWEANRIKQ